MKIQEVGDGTYRFGTLILLARAGDGTYWVVAVERWMTESAIRSMIAECEPGGRLE